MHEQVVYPEIYQANITINNEIIVRWTHFDEDPEDFDYMVYLSD